MNTNKIIIIKKKKNVKVFLLHTTNYYISLYVMYLYVVRRKINYSYYNLLQGTTILLKIRYTTLQTSVLQ